MTDFELVRLKKDDCSELVSFLNRVFTLQNKKEEHFEKSTPRIFKEDDETMGYHIAAKSEGKIIGCAGTYPITYKIGGNEVKVGSVESVAVDPEYRGLGIMQKMMDAMEKENVSKYDICYLLGDRKRYSHFGFDRCGAICTFNIKMSMLGKDEPEKKYSFELIESGYDKILKSVFDFYITQETYRIREYDIFYDSMTTQDHLLYAIVDEKEKVCGYFLTNSSSSEITEICLEDKADFEDVFKCYMSFKNLSLVYLTIPLYHVLFEKAYEFCDRYNLIQPGCYKINNFKKVVESYMKEKSKGSNMLDGTLNIDSEIFGKWSISKNGDNIIVEKFKGNAQIILSSKDTYQFFFGALANFNFTDKDVSTLVKSWFPLPLYTPPML